MANSSPKRICVLPGDGIGPEVITPAVALLEQVASLAGVRIVTRHAALGGDALERFGTPLPEESLEACQASNAILLGAVGGPKWDSYPRNLRPERALLSLRQELGLYCNLRPVRQLPSLVVCSPLKPELVREVDLVVVRELTGGLYFGEPRGISGAHGSEVGTNAMVYHRHEIVRIARRAFELARLRRKKVTSVDKANVLEVSQLWRRVVEDVHTEYPEIDLGHQYVDNCAMQLVLRPSQFDVLLTENTFGDILSDLGGVLTGSIGTLPSASLGSGPTLYEPVHGTAPDIAGRNLANPIGAIGCVAMMFDISFGRPDLSSQITSAVDQVLRQGYHTQDLAQAGGRVVGTVEFVAMVQEQLTRGIGAAQSA